MILLELSWSFCKIGFTSFGGLSMVPLINSEMISHSWMTASEVSDIVAIAEMTPGPLGINCATFAGIRVAGVAGAVCASLGVLSPTLLVCSIAGYGFEIYHDKAKDALMSVLLLAMMLPFVAIMIPLFKMMSHWGLVNSWAAFVLPSISTPFMIMLFRQASRSFPNDIIEAARLDGLSEIGIFFRMFVPIMRSTYGAAMTVTFMNAWNSYLWPKIIFQNNASITMPMLVANLKSGYSVDYGMLMLGVLICTLPTAIIFLCLQKSFANGITGAVK